MSSDTPPTSLAPIRRHSIEDEVYQRLRETILKGDLSGGERLIHANLAKRFGTSRIPVRDALKRLLADGLVETDERGTYRVTHCGVEDVHEIYALRELLESHAVALAVPRLDKEDLLQIERLQDDMETAAEQGEAATYVTLNQAFHNALYDSADQPRLVRMIHGLWQGLPPLTPMTIDYRLEQSNREHRAIIKALQDGDADHAAETMRAHIACAGKALQEYVSAREGKLR